MINHLSASAPSGDQRAKPVTVTSWTNEPLVSPVSADTLAAWLGLSTPLSLADASMLDALLLAACDYYTRMSGRELLAREWNYTTSRTPERSPGFSGVAPVAPHSAWWIELPRVPVASITSVSVDGTATTDYQSDLNHEPARITLGVYGSTEIVYQAGYATAAEIPPSVITGITMLAAYLYEHRGACAVDDAATKSGASTMFQLTSVVFSL